MPEDERKSEIIGTQSEMKSRKRFVSLLLTDRVRLFESGTENCTVTDQSLLEKSGLIKSVALTELGS